MNRRNIIDEALINLAIEELINKSDKVTVPKVASITGYPAHAIYNERLMDAYVRHHKVIPPRKRSSVSTPAPTHIPQEKLAHTLEAYMLHIKDNYFNRIEIASNVMSDMFLTVENFNKDLFNRAINKMQVDGLLKPSTLLPGALSGHYDYPVVDIPNCIAKPTSAPDIQFILFDESTQRVYPIGDEKSLDEKIGELLAHEDKTFKIFHPYEIVKKVITRAKIQPASR